MGAAEKWRPVVGYEGRYEISDQGHARSLLGRTALVLQTSRDAWGYLRVNLYTGGKCRTVKIHQMVARAFLGEPNGFLVRHLDGDHDNNNVQNLAYGTVAENNRDTVIHGHNVYANRTHCPSGHEYSEENTYRWRTSRICRTCRRDRPRAARKAVSS